MQRGRMILQASLAGLLCLVSLNFPGQDIAVAATVDRNSQWGFTKPIEIAGKAPYHALYLDEEVYRQASNDLRDLRIVDGNGGFVPFYKDSGITAAEEQSLTYSSVLVHTAKKGVNTSFDYKITPIREDADIQGNKLVFTLPDEAFLKHVQVLGSYDGNVWEPLTKGDLYSTDGGVEQNSIELGTAYKFSYYRLVVANNSENLNFSTLLLLHNSTELKTTDYRRLRTPAYEIKKMGDQTQILVHNSDHLKVSKIMLKSTGNFIRKYELLDGSERNIETQGDGMLYRLDFQDAQDAQIAATDIVPFTTVTAPSFTIVIYNHDDAPLSISGLSMEYLIDKLVFAEEGVGPYRLLYGNPGASTPQYDIVNFKAHIEVEGVALAKLGAESVVPKTSVDSSSQVGWFQSRIWFNGVIIAVSLLLIIMLIRKMNRT
ncbi:DUF3999 family protein [Paenibacillus monticola]|uniref:DUF3999 family protein n=1 Tax=Paenibacillus monticola TaxID=2666075 RepID=A0A7X2L383_9BACL|nr:DUF3999 family protein [Paenibacillus monticola]MRN54081.1 DUF3999 family protein [Paenibacillus monticola]